MTMPLQFSLPSIPDLGDAALAMDLQHVLDCKAKPQGALGQLEALAVQLGLILGTETPRLVAPQLLVFAGDHGLAAQGVSAYTSDATWQMVVNILAGGAAVSVLARQHGLALTVVDCGVQHDFLPAGQTERAGVDGLPNLLIRKSAAGTADSSQQPAMTVEQCQQAMAQGLALVQAMPGNALLLGDTGIGNSSSASLLLARLAELDITVCTGTNTGLDADAVLRKTTILARVLQRHAHAAGPMAALAAFGGYEIATMVGAVLQAAHERRVMLVDGFTASAAVMVAQAFAPHVVQRCVFAHHSGERNHALMMDRLGAEPLLSMGLRSGEGSGAALAWPLLESACRVLNEMATRE